MTIFSALGCYIFKTLRNKSNFIILYYLALVAFPLTPKYVTSNDHFVSYHVLRWYV